MILQQTHSSKKYRLGYIPALNGLRGIAVMAVFIYHCAPHRFPGGMLGVDLFFVISGYLITTLLAREFESSGTIHFGRFYLRRFLRLAPPLLAACLIFAIVASFFDSSNAGKHWLDSGIAVVYAGNWTRAFGLNRPDWLGHTWSLAIEEQYYLFWPIIFSLLLRTRKSMTKLGFIALALGLTSWLWRYIYMQMGASIDRVYNGTDTRLDGLLMGSALALFLQNSSVKEWFVQVHHKAKWIGVIAIVSFLGLCKGMHLDDPLLYAFGFGGVGLLGMALVSEVILVPFGRMTRILEWKPLVWIGDYSYGIYLWHMLVIRLFVIHSRPWYEILTVGFVATLILVLISYKWIESPALRFKSKLG